MSHPREIIRKAIRTQLLNVTSLEDRIETNRYVPVGPTRYPFASIYSSTETVDPASKHTAPRRLKRTAQMNIEFMTAGAGNQDDAIDALARQVEVAMAQDDTLGDSCSDSMLVNTEQDQFIDGKLIIGVCRLTYDVEYYDDMPAEVEGLDDFETAHLVYDVPGGEDEDAVDDVTLPIDEPEE